MTERDFSAKAFSFLLTYTDTRSSHDNPCESENWIKNPKLYAESHMTSPDPPGNKLCPNLDEKQGTPRLLTAKGDFPVKSAYPDCTA